MSEAPDLTQMVMDIGKQLKSTYFIIPNNFRFNNFSKKSIPGDAWAQVLQEPVSTSHANQGRKTGVPHPFSVPGDQEESTGTQHLALASKLAFHRGGLLFQYIRIFSSKKWRHLRNKEPFFSRNPSFLPSICKGLVLTHKFIT